MACTLSHLICAISGWTICARALCLPVATLHCRAKYTTASFSTTPQHNTHRVQSSTKAQNRNAHGSFKLWNSKLGRVKWKAAGVTKLKGKCKLKAKPKIKFKRSWIHFHCNTKNSDRILNLLGAQWTHSLKDRQKYKYINI